MPENWPECAANMKSTYGVNIYAMSIQNEPDVSTTYASCLWNSQQFHDFRHQPLSRDGGEQRFIDADHAAGG